MSIDDLEKLTAPLREHVVAPIEFPEPAMRLDLTRRESAPDRQFKHIHQMCFMHSEHFAIAHQIKLVALLDGYLATVKAANPLGPYLFSRSIFELTAFSYEVAVRLTEIASKPDSNWRSKGEEFFGMIVRARFATTDPKKRQILEAAGCPARMLKPMNVMNCIATLLADPDASSTLVDQYERLCDFVHHNLSSQLASSPGVRLGDVARSAAGGAIVMAERGPITRYEYPVTGKARLAVEETLPVVMKCVEICVQQINRMPRTPFSQDQLREKTGTNFGVTTLIPPRRLH